MALIYKGVRCAICDREIDIDCKESYVATTRFIGDSSDPFWRFSDAVMHYDCFKAWPHRAEFVKKYNSTIGQKVWGNGTRHQMHPDGRVESVSARPG
jgi:hypothetical protein